MKKNRASIGSDVIETVLKTYPQLDLVWLMTGEGEMIKPDSTILRSGKLPKAQIAQIEQIVEAKMKEHHINEIRDLLKEVTEEIERRKSSGES